MSAIEQKVHVQGFVAPRIAPADLQANITSAHYFIVSDAIQHPNAIHEPIAEGWYLGTTQRVTICVLQLVNGSVAIGESVIASDESFDAETGRKIARQNAEAKVWPLMGYELPSQLLEASPS